MSILNQIGGIPRPGKSSFDTAWMMKQLFNKTKTSTMKYNVQVNQQVPVTEFTGEDVIALPTGSIVHMKATFPGIGQLQPQILMRTNCPAHPLINLMNGEVLETISDEMKFTYLPNVQSVVLEKFED